METERLYLHDTYLFEADVCIQSIIELESKHGSHSVTLNKTVFHPQARLSFFVLKTFSMWACLSGRWSTK